MSNAKLTSAVEPPANWLPIVQKQVSSLRYGEVHIIIHDGRVVQVDTTERVRFDKNSSQTY